MFVATVRVLALAAEVRGIMTGGIAVHWDPADGIVTGNPIVEAG